MCGLESVIFCVMIFERSTIKMFKPGFLNLLGLKLSTEA